MRVKLLLFAVLRDIAGIEEADLDVDEGSRALDLWNDLRAKHQQLAGIERPPMTAINLEYVSPETVLSPGDEVAFIPPVSGG